MSATDFRKTRFLFANEKQTGNPHEKAYFGNVSEIRDALEYRVAVSTDVIPKYSKHCARSHKGAAYDLQTFKSGYSVRSSKSFPKKRRVLYLL